MNNEDRLTLKIQALREMYVKRTNELDDEVANYRVAITELSRTLQNTQQEFENYKSAHPEESSVQEEPQEDDSQD